MAGKIGVYFDQQNIGGGLDLTALAEQTSQKWGDLVPVVKVVPVLALAVSEIKADIEAQGLDGVLLCGSSPRVDAEIYRLPVQVEHVNLREQCVQAYKNPDKTPVDTANGAPELLALMFKPEGSLAVIGKKKCWVWHLWDVLWDEAITHRKFDDCENGPDTGQITPNRKIGHMLLVYSFAILAFVTAVVAGGHWIGKVVPLVHIETPMALTFPVKILANLGALMLLAGLAVLTVRRVTLNPKFQGSSWHDWYLLGIIWLVAVTGVLSQCFRLADVIVPAFLVYYLHLVFVWMLFAYLPWSKLGHFVYRTAALVYARMYGRS